MDFEDFFDFSEVPDKSKLTFSAELQSRDEGKRSLGKIYDGPLQPFRRLTLTSRDKDLQVEFYFQKLINEELLLVLTKQGEVYLVELDAHGLPRKLQEDIARIRLDFHDNSVNCNDAAIWGEEEDALVLVCQKSDPKSNLGEVWVQMINLSPFSAGSLVHNSFQAAGLGFRVDNFLNLIAVEASEGARYLGVTKRYINSSPESG